MVARSRSWKDGYKLKDVGGACLQKVLHNLSGAGRIFGVDVELFTVVALLHNRSMLQSGVQYTAMVKD